MRKKLLDIKGIQYGAVIQDSGTIKMLKNSYSGLKRAKYLCKLNLLIYYIVTQNIILT